MEKVKLGQGPVEFNTHRPQGKTGVVLFSCPSAECEGLVTSFWAHASWWHTMPPGSGWVKCGQHDTPKVSKLETNFGLTVAPLPSIECCPMCGKKPKLRGARRAPTGDVNLLAPPPYWNHWWLECCPWAARTPGKHPAALIRERNAAVRAATARVKLPPPEIIAPEESLQHSERRLLANLLEYVKHDPDCTRFTPRPVGKAPSPCDCGLEELLPRAQRAVEADPCAR